MKVQLREASLFSVERHLRPIWQGEVVYEESVLFASEKDGRVLPKMLFYRPEEILSVTSFDGQTVYEEGRDFVLADEKLLLPAGSRIPVWRFDELYPDTDIGDCFRRVGGGYFYFKEEDAMFSRQVLVSYRHADKVSLPFVSGKDPKLENVLRLLKEKRPVTALFYGDSITCGYNSSGSDAIVKPPFLPTYPEMTVLGLQKQYGYDEIHLVNTAVAGTETTWGLKNMKENVLVYAPDLLVLAFGMNDASGKLPAADFIKNIRSMMDRAISQNPKLSIILVSTTLPNPLAADFIGPHETYEPALLRLAEDYSNATVCRMTAMHKQLLSRKAFADMTGNHVNHPNDFLARVYAQMILAHLI